MWRISNYNDQVPYICIFQMFKSLNEIPKGEATAKLIHQNSTYHKDELANEYSIVHYGRLNLPQSLLQKEEGRMIRRPLMTTLRNDDIFLMTYPRTGLILFFI